LKLLTEIIQLWRRSRRSFEARATMTW